MVQTGRGGRSRNRGQPLTQQPSQWGCIVNSFFKQFERQLLFKTQLGRCNLVCALNCVCGMNQRTRAYNLKHAAVPCRIVPCRAVLFRQAKEDSLAALPVCLKSWGPAAVRPHLQPVSGSNSSSRHSLAPMLLLLLAHSVPCCLSCMHAFGGGGQVVWETVGEPCKPFLTAPALPWCAGVADAQI